ncbi:hypothetical protein BG60_05155 [Caballeronia zhejiangensis]|uniref:Uncharacterized protein n=1 Tax=Caballeronia zhejiangensis TaxID=871203 RepID=A0A656QKB1_9BURK|nr:hypothetical protein BG60_05155 [Caballeronia zhejiangensis]
MKIARQKKCGPAIEGPHSLFTHTAKQFGRRRIWSSTSVAPKLFRSTFDVPCFFAFCAARFLRFETPRTEVR